MHIHTYEIYGDQMFISVDGPSFLKIGCKANENKGLTGERNFN